MSTPEHYRPVRSYVRREGRITDGQKRALESHWADLGIDAPAAGQRLDPVALFGAKRPLTVEIGFGNGDNILSRAAQEPDRSFIGIEVHRPGVGGLMQRAVAGGLGNLRVACHDAVEVIRDWLPAGCADELQILFPDPWHKKRHHKRRLVDAGFLDLAAQLLADGGALLLATDWANYAEQMIEVIGADARFANTASDGDFVSRPESRPLTRFEARGHRLGHEVFDLAFRKSAEAAGV